MSEKTNKLHLAQQFSIPNYITVGDIYDKRISADSRFQGKQFTTNPLKLGKTNDTLFEKGHPWLHEGKRFDDKSEYRLRQKEKRKGFMSGDFKKRDEFTEHFRSEQYKERLRHESHLIRSLASRYRSFTDDDIALSSLGTLSQGNMPLSDSVYTAPTYTFDVIMAQTKAVSCPKCPRDRHLCPHVCPRAPPPSFARSMLWESSSTEYGFGVDDKVHEKPLHARCNIVRSTFWHRTLGNLKT